MKAIQIFVFILVCSVQAIAQTPPQANCTPFTVFLGANGNASVTPSDFDAGSSGVIVNAYINNDTVINLTCVDAGLTIPITFLVVDSIGLQDSCITSLTVLDVDPPTMSCNTNLTVTLDATGIAEVSDTLIDNGSTDNCGIISFQLNGGTVPITYSCADIGLDTVTLTASDGSANFGTCTSIITIADVDAPVMNCNTALSLTLDANGTAVVSDTSFDNGSTDNCGIISFQLNGGPGPITYSCADIGLDTVTLTASDGSSNIGTCVSVVNILWGPGCAPSTVNPDSVALLEFRAATGGGLGFNAIGWQASLPATQQWIPTNPISQWFGVSWVLEVGTSLLRTNSISLTNLGLTDSLPNNLFDVGRMDSLVLLELDSNQIQYWPSNDWLINSNTQLEVINISHNEFVYDANAFLRVANNADGLIAFIATSYLSDLEWGNTVPDLSAPSLFANLSELKLGSNGFSGDLPPLALIPSLSIASFEDNFFTGMDTLAGPFNNLFYLDVSNNQLVEFSTIGFYLANAASLKFLLARDAMNINTHAFENVSVASNFLNGTIDLGNNRLSGVINLSGNEMQSIRNLSLDNNLFSGIIPPTGLLDSIRTLDLSYNLIDNKLDSLAQLFMAMPKIEFLYINNNQLRGKMPPLTVLNVPLNFRFENLREFDMSNNNVRGKIHLGQLLNQQIQSGNLGLEKLNISNNNFDEVVYFNLNQYAYEFLSQVNVSNNKFGFDDLYKFVFAFGMERYTTSGATFDYYAPLAATIAPSGFPDSLSFNYLGQTRRGVGGVKRRAPNTTVGFSGLNADPKLGISQDLWNKYEWYQGIDSTINPTGHVFCGSFDAVNGAQSFLPNVVVAPLMNGVPMRSTMAIQNLDAAAFGNQYYYAIVTNDSFPLVEIVTDPKKLIVGDCFDELGNVIACQQIMVQYDEDLINLSGNPDSVKTAIREEFGIKVVESCLCGGIELWELSDTSNILEVEAFGRGTRSTATQAGGKTELLSADPNYNLLGNINNTITPSTGLPSGNTNPDATLVAIIDSGVDYDHPELSNSIVLNPADSSQNDTDDDGDCLQDNAFGYNFIDDNANPDDDHGHGTQVAGIVMGKSDYNILPSSGTENVAILPLKYTDKDGEGTAFHAACAIRHAADYAKANPGGSDSMRVRVINASWGYYGEPINVLRDVIQYAAEDCDILFVCSAGNDGVDNDTTNHYPSDFDLPNILVVAATENAANGGNADYLESYSNYGQQDVDLAAIGYDLTTDPLSTNNNVSVTGTSFASAQVSRAAAQLFNNHPDASYYQVKIAMMQSVDPLNSPDASKLRSGGRLNLSNAINVLDTMTDRTFCPTIITSIDQYEEAHGATAILNQMKLYPNPFGNYINIDYEGIEHQPVQIQLTSISGVTLYQNEISSYELNNFRIDTEKIPAGLYLFQLKTGKAIKTVKIVKH